MNISNELSQAISPRVLIRRLFREQPESKTKLANIAAKAQQIIDQHRVEHYDEPQEPITFWNKPLYQGQNRSLWRIMVAKAVADHNGCTIYTNSGDIDIIGRPDDVDTVRLLFNWYIGEVERLAKFWTAGWGKTYSTSFRLGAAAMLQQRLISERSRLVERMHHEGVANEAIAKLESQQEEVEQWSKKNVGLHDGKPFKYTPDAEAYAQGQQKAKEINLTPLTLVS